MRSDQEASSEEVIRPLMEKIERLLRHESIAIGQKQYLWKIKDRLKKIGFLPRSELLALQKIDKNLRGIVRQK